MAERHIPAIAVLASGNGTTVEAFIHASQAGTINAEVGLVVCNNVPEKAGIYQRINRLNHCYGLDIEVARINSRTHPDPDGLSSRGQTLAESAAICRKVADGGFAHVALMGYMKVVRGDLLEEYGWQDHFTAIYQGRMSNTHPGPLPETADTYGLGASQRVLELGLTASKHTLHLVAAGVDEGPIIAEHPVEILAGATAAELAKDVQIAEKMALPYALDKFLREQEAYIAGREAHGVA